MSETVNNMDGDITQQEKNDEQSDEKNDTQNEYDQTTFVEAEQYSKKMIFKQEKNSIVVIVDN